MKKLLHHYRAFTAVLFFLLFSLLPAFGGRMSGGAFAQGIDFFHGSWEEALELARQQEKIIFVDAYAVWCGPCKRMAKTVFTDPEVGAFYNQHFINMKLDMEQGEGLKFRQKYPVSAFPTLFYIDYTGEVIQQVKGFQKSDAFIALGEKALSKVDRSKQYAEAYEKGNRDPELIYKYVKALNQAGKPSLKIANDYLRSQTDLTTPFNLRFIYEATTEADSRIFDLFVQHRDRIAFLVGGNEVNERIYKACSRTVEKAIAFRSEDLLKEAKAKMKKYYPQKAKAFGLKADMDFYKATGDEKRYLKASKKYAKHIIWEDASALDALAKTIAVYLPHDAKAMKLALKISARSAEIGESYMYYYTYANLLLQAGLKDKALETAQQALKMAEEISPNAKAMVEALIRKIHNS
ncbi:MAG TPA: DUF255 domain-containing protein [Phaeodactylibacter sp.]|nr:DUF255 domain-containing protein [Phaeodactylibacter sp.]